MGISGQVKVKGPDVVWDVRLAGQCFILHDGVWPLTDAIWVIEFPSSTPLMSSVSKFAGFLCLKSGAPVPTVNCKEVHGLPSIVPTRALIETFESTH